MTNTLKQYLFMTLLISILTACNQNVKSTASKNVSGLGSFAPRLEISCAKIFNKTSESESVEICRKSL